jgi:hypothetical protein
MKPRYIIVDKVERDWFEMKWQLPYGYGNCHVFNNKEDAINFYKKHDDGNCIIEKYDKGFKEEFIYEEEEV